VKLKQKAGVEKLLLFFGYFKGRPNEPKILTLASHV
jgi:hypothetical protein